MLKDWEYKQQVGANRMACMACGTHSMVLGAPVLCSCCGSPDVRPFTQVESYRSLHPAPSVMRDRPLLHAVA